jgi:hypothetical protein
MDRDDDRDPFEEAYWAWSLSRVAPALALVFVGGFVWLFLHYPTTWAALSAAAFVLGSGLFTARFFLGIRGWGRSWLLSPVIGLGWLSLLWLLYRAQR